MKYIVSPGMAIHGRITVPGDKSITQRAYILAAIANGISTIHQPLVSEDCHHTQKALAQVGARFNVYDHSCQVVGVGKQGLRAAKDTLYLGNSGTGLRLLIGLLAGAGIQSSLDGDSSLKQRPMARIIEPLTRMGATLVQSSDNQLPISIMSNKPLQGINYELPIASAQVKSALLLAGLFAKGETTLTGKIGSRDHTEKMLQSFCYPVEVNNNTIKINSNSPLSATDINVPGDFSSAAFFIVACCISNNSRLEISNVGVNPHRIGLIDGLLRMGAHIKLKNHRFYNNEPVADIYCESSCLRGTSVSADDVPSMIDELPVFMIAAACAQGETMILGAQELRHKESDRLGAMIKGLRALGIHCDEIEDGLTIQGGTFNGAEINSHQDHRIAMAFAVAGLRAKEQIIINDCANVVTSFPNFVQLASKIGLKIKQVEKV